MSRIVGAVTYAAAWVVIVIGVFTDVNPILTGFCILLAIMGTVLSWAEINAVQQSEAAKALAENRREARDLLR